MSEAIADTIPRTTWRPFGLQTPARAQRILYSQALIGGKYAEVHEVMFSPLMIISDRDMWRPMPLPPRPSEV